MSGWTSYLKIDQLLFLPMQSVSMAVSTFVDKISAKAMSREQRKAFIVQRFFL
jgi:Na+-driven multidrug efflux pump